MAQMVHVRLPGQRWKAHIMETAALGWAALIYKPALFGDGQTCVFKAYGFDGPDDAEGAVRDAAARMCAWWSQHRQEAGR